MVRTFFLKILFLLIPAVLVVGFFEYNLAKIPTTYSIKKSNIEKKAPEIKVLILGPSHAIVGINPAFFSREAFNMADTSQSLYYDLELFSKYSTQLTNLQVLIIPVSYFSLQFSFDKGPESWRSFFYDRTYNITPAQKNRRLDVRKYSLFALYGQQRSLLYALKGFKTDLAPSVMENGYQRDDHNDAANINGETGKLQVDIHASIMDPRYFEENVRYVEQMITIAKERNVMPVIVTSPVSSAYSENIDTAVYTQMVTALEKISSEQNIRYFNHFDDNNFSIEDFADTSHLNSKGAEKFTKILEKEIFLR